MKTATKERPIIFSGPMVKAIIEGRKTQTRRVVKDADDFIETDEDGNFVFSHAPTCGGYCDYACAAEGEVLEGHVGWTPWGSHPERRSRLWVREALKRNPATNEWEYADGKVVSLPPKHPSIAAMIGWAHHKEGDSCSPIHMPRWASRLTLEVAGVRVERLDEISEADAVSEGFESDDFDTKQVWWQGYDSRLVRENESMPHAQCPGEQPPEWMVEPKKMLVNFGLQRARQKFMCGWDRINGKKHPWESNPWVWVISFQMVTR